MMSLATQNIRLCNADFSKWDRQNKLQPDQERMGDSLELSCLSLLRNPKPKPTGVLEHYD